MSSIEELETQVAKLSREVRRLKGNPEARERKVVEELTGTNPDEPGFNRGGFHALCEESRARVHRELRAKAIQELNSGRVITPFDVAQFRDAYVSVHDVDALIANHVAGKQVE